MRRVGKRIEAEISFSASAEKLIEGARFNDEIHKLPTGHTSFFPKGVYRYKSHEEANRHWMQYVIQGMVENALKNGKISSR